MVLRPDCSRVQEEESTRKKKSDAAGEKEMALMEQKRRAATAAINRGDQKDADTTEEEAESEVQGATVRLHSRMR